MFIDEGVAISQETGVACFGLLLSIGCAAKFCFIRDPANLAPAEQAFQTAVAVARHQGARSYELFGYLFARQALLIDQPPSRSPGRPCPRPRRFRADARNAGDR